MSSSIIWKDLTSAHPCFAHHSLASPLNSQHSSASTQSISINLILLIPFFCETHHPTLRFSCDGQLLPKGPEIDHVRWELPQQCRAQPLQQLPLSRRIRRQRVRGPRVNNLTSIHLDQCAAAEFDLEGARGRRRPGAVIAYA